MNKFIIISLLCLSSYAQSSNTLWSSIPFTRGADLCAYKQAYSQTRMEYMQDMVGLASRLMRSGARGKEALKMLQTFDSMYDKNLYLASKGKYLDVTLENSFKSFLDSYYRSIAVSERQIIFVDQRDIYGSNSIDYISYGSYSFAPNCKGNIQVTITIVGKDYRAQTFSATGNPSVVMSKIASDIFTQFQRTRFPSTLYTLGRKITIVGTHNNSIGTARSHNQAKEVCRSKDARLPTSSQLEAIDAFGDWNGGVSIGKAVWMLRNGQVYVPHLMNPTPVRHIGSINSRSFKYYCVK